MDIIKVYNNRVYAVYTIKALRYYHIYFHFIQPAAIQIKKNIFHDFFAILLQIIRNGDYP